VTYDADEEAPIEDQKNVAESRLSGTRKEEKSGRKAGPKFLAMLATLCLGGRVVENRRYGRTKVIWNRFRESRLERKKRRYE